MKRCVWAVVSGHVATWRTGPCSRHRQPGHSSLCFMGCDALVATSTVYNQILQHGGFFQLSANRNKTVLLCRRREALTPSWRAQGL